MNIEQALLEQIQFFTPEQQNDTQLVVSIVSLWEIQIKTSKGGPG